MLDRRSLITGLIFLGAAPAIVRAGSLMPVKVMEPTAVFTSYGNGIAIKYDLLDIVPLKWNGIDIFFDFFALDYTVYMLPERER